MTKNISSQKIEQTASSQKGMTLMEILIALSILTTLSTSLTTGILAVRRAAEKTVFEATAHGIANSFLEQIKSLEYSTVLQPAGNGSQIALATRINHDVLTSEEQQLQSWETNPVEVIIDEERSRKILGLQFMPRLVDRQDPTDENSLPITEIIIDYEWKDPATGEVKQRTVKGARSQAISP